ncbi:MAG TPA: hypothetical protein VJH97_04495 [Candidatus Nanoarchaeia archaeon]|nr:hypothetical protein [Candidatus Nanoarchaeia archaeon]
MKHLVLVLLLSVVLFGCTSNSGGNQGPSDGNFRTGTQGLEIYFPVGLPDQIYENDFDVKIPVGVQNKGAFPQFDELGDFEAYLWIGGYDSNIININPDNGIRLDERDLEGKSQFLEGGGIALEEFTADVRDLPSGAPFYKPNILFTVTYFYKTVASPVVCIDPEPRSSTVRDKVCSVQDSISVSSQGAPIAVTRVEQDVGSQTMRFRIYIRNAGNGIVIPQEDVDLNPNIGYDWRELNEIRIDDIQVGDTRMSSCRPDIGDRVELINGEGVISCTFDSSLADNRVFTTPLNIELSYGYSTSQSRVFEVFEAIDI